MLDVHAAERSSVIAALSHRFLDNPTDDVKLAVQPDELIGAYDTHGNPAVSANYDATIVPFIPSPPQTLIIVIQRGKSDVSGLKLLSRLDIATKLYFDCVTTAPEPSKRLFRAEPAGRYVYDLYGSVVHSGKHTDYGHYYSYVRDDKG